MQKNKTNILLFGKNGQVGFAFNSLLKKDENFELQSYSSKDVDFSKLNDLRLFLENLNKKPQIIINAAAYTNVEKAEDERDLADLINHKAVELIAKFCQQNQITLIHFSTDYVFDGSGNEPFTTNNTKNLKPLNHYGQTKLDGERAIINSKCNYLIIRTSWVYDDQPNSKNFVNTITKLAQEKEELNIICDQVGSPTSANFIAQNTLKYIKKIIDDQILNYKRIIHLVEPRYISWYDFATEIIEELKNNNEIIKVKKINPIKTSEYHTKAKRPLNSRMSFNIDELE